MTTLRSAFRVTLIAGCACGFACALLLLGALVFRVSMSGELWMSWTRLLIAGKALAIIGYVGESRTSGTSPLAARTRPPIAGSVVLSLPG